MKPPYRAPKGQHDGPRNARRSLQSNEPASVNLRSSGHPVSIGTDCSVFVDWGNSRNLGFELIVEAPEWELESLRTPPQRAFAQPRWSYPTQNTVRHPCRNPHSNDEGSFVFDCGPPEVRPLRVAFVRAFDPAGLREKVDCNRVLKVPSTAQVVAGANLDKRDVKPCNACPINSAGLCPQCH